MRSRSEILEIIPYEDSRGCLKKILMQSHLEAGRIEEVYLIYTGKGSVRGNHYHKITLEYFTVVSGRAAILLKDLSTGVLQELKISAHDNKIIKVPPGVVHAFKNETEEPLIILAVSTREYDKGDPDTYTCRIM
jgi:dTDP-4-dehydrorhamnose 3,5-epimerase